MLDNLTHLGNEPSKSCSEGTPLMELENGSAAVLNYNLPQSSCFSVQGTLILKIDGEAWSSVAQSKPDHSFFDLAADKDANEIIHALKLSQATGREIDFLDADPLVATSAHDGQVQSKGKDDRTRGEGDESSGGTGSGKEDRDRGNTSGSHGKGDRDRGQEEELVSLIQAGYQPIHHSNLFGDLVIDWIPEPPSPTPELAICFHFKVCSFLGDYGAGKTVKTFSLLPGEKTTISIKTFLHQDSTKKKSETVLDSFSKESAAELEVLLEEESSILSEVNTSDTSTSQNSKSKNWSVGGGVGLSAKKVDVNLSGGVGGGSTNSSVVEKALNGHLSDINRVLENALDRQVESSSAVRDVAVNSEAVESVNRGEERSVIRTLENTNFSRVLNFVFRQLVQEYFSITYLDQISVVYHNGFPQSRRVAELGDLNEMLVDLIPDGGTRKKTIEGILSYLCKIKDWEGNYHQFIEEKVEPSGGCLEMQASETEHTYWGKKAGLSQSYLGRSVPGVIVGVKHRILPTDSVIAEAVLGQGEALDCYNQQLQAAAVDKARLENRLMEMEIKMRQQAIEIISQIKDPERKAELYKKVWGECCDVPQTTVIN